jgi:hypothetical protein
VDKPKRRKEKIPGAQTTIQVVWAPTVSSFPSFSLPNILFVVVVLFVVAVIVCSWSSRHHRSSSATRRHPCPCLVGVLSFAPCCLRFCGSCRPVDVLPLPPSSWSPSASSLVLPPREQSPAAVVGGVLVWCSVVALLSVPRHFIVAPRSYPE